MHVKFEVCSFNRFGAISILNQKFRGHVTLATPPFEKFFKGSCPTVPGNTLVKLEVCRLNRFGDISI